MSLGRNNNNNNSNNKTITINERAIEAMWPVRILRLNESGREREDSGTNFSLLLAFSCLSTDRRWAFFFSPESRTSGWVKTYLCIRRCMSFVFAIATIFYLSSSKDMYIRRRNIRDFSTSLSCAQMPVDWKRMAYCQFSRDRRTFQRYSGHLIITTIQLT